MSNRCARRFLVVAFQSKKWFEVKENEAMIAYSLYLRLTRICITETRTLNCKKEKNLKKRIIESQNVTIEKTLLTEIILHTLIFTHRDINNSLFALFGYNIECNIKYDDFCDSLYKRFHLIFTPAQVASSRWSDENRKMAFWSRIRASIRESTFTFESFETKLFVRTKWFVFEYSFEWIIFLMTRFETFYLGHYKCRKTF